MFAKDYEHGTFPDATTIWRYMDLERFLALVCTGNLHLARLDNLGDPWEGTWPPIFLTKWSKGGSQKINYILDTNKTKKTMFTSCWHASEYESAALWEMYSGGADIVIRSTIGKLKVALQDKKSLGEVSVGCVKYVDFATEDPPLPLSTMTPAFLKRKSFDCEREVRVVMIRPANEVPKESHQLTCDIRALIDHVFLNPKREGYDWVKPVVERLLEELGLGDIPVEKSPLYQPR